MKRIPTLALALAAFVAVVGGGLSLLTLLPLMGLAWGALDVLWLAALPLAWVLAAGKAKKPTPKQAGGYILPMTIGDTRYARALEKELEP